MKLSDLPYEEKRILHYFDEISRVPRVSGNTAQIANYLENFAKEKGLKYYRDSSDNIVIYKAATKGHEERPTVILQGHTDMVGAIAAGVTHDFSREGVRITVDGDMLKAEGTTLGGDNGVAVAYMLAILEGGDGISHPTLECVFTSDEETGLFGATALDASVLEGRIMINLDSDGEGTFIAGCAGGVRINLSLSFNSEACDDIGYSISLSGFTGGHSGEDIDKGRLNAIKELADITSSLSRVRIDSFVGGTADNVIPTDAKIKLTCKENYENVTRIFAEALVRIKETEKNARIQITQEKCKTLFSEEDSEAVLKLVEALPYGVYAMSREIEGMVETSNNLGLVSISEDGVKFSLSVRSSINDEKLALAEKIENIAKIYGATAERRGNYPGWKYNKDSKIRELVCKVYEENYGKKPYVHTIHAGLECGIFQGKLEGLDCISMGPDNYYIHTAEESLSLPSFERTYKYLKNVLKEI